MPASAASRGFAATAITIDKAVAATARAARAEILTMALTMPGL
jgi:hypothetical protein